jgi:tRNA nucleotidyltransferase/poly(A) polymerase
MLLGRPVHDLDFALGSGTIRSSRQVADALGGAFFALDAERDMGRVILVNPGGERMKLDFAALRGADLENDLRLRDFTINAMAVDIDHPEVVLDPLGGAADLRQGVIRPCTSSALADDPVRILRGVRQSVEFGFRIHPETIRLIRQSALLLPSVSPERLRDELFHIFEGPQPATALRILDTLGILPYILPELPALKGVQQSAPHVSDVWTHTLDVIQRVNQVLQVLDLVPDEENSANLAMGLLSVRLGRYRQQIHKHLEQSLNPDRSLRGLLVLAALYHDVAKPVTRLVEPGGRVRFFEHEQRGAWTVSERAQELRLSNDETGRLRTIIHGHLRPILLAQVEQSPSNRAVYHFFRDTGLAGVDICLLSLADVLATYGPDLPQDVWKRQLDVVRTLLEAWWEKPEERVSPPALINGTVLMDEFGLQPGPQIGQLLDAVREAQVTAQVHTRQQALDFVRQQLESGVD